MLIFLSIQIKKEMIKRSFPFSQTGNVLLSQAVARQVPSAFGSLTSVFEMGTGVASQLLSPDFLLVNFPPDFGFASSSEKFPSQYFEGSTFKTK